MKTKLVITITATLCFLIPSVSFAGTLTQTQVNAVIGLLEAFGVSAQTVEIVQNDLEPQSLQPVVSISPQESIGQSSDFGMPVPPRDLDGEIHQLEISASAQYHNIAFTSEENYTNCIDSMTVITIGKNQQPVFATYRDIFSAGTNLFAGDQHSIAYGSLIDTNGDTLIADILAGMYVGADAAGDWGLTCDQGQYSLEINAVE